MASTRRLDDEDVDVARLSAWTCLGPMLELLPF